VYKKRDAGAAAQFDIDLMAALAPYYELEGGGIVVTQEQPDQDISVLESLRAENQRLSDELSVTMETMSRMLNEYSTMFTGGSLAHPGPIAALFGGAAADVSGPDGETVREPVPGQTAPPFDQDTAVEMAAEAEIAAVLETDAETGVDADVAVEEGGGDADDVDMAAQDDIDALFAAESDAPLSGGLGNTEAVSNPPAELDEPIGTDDSIDQPVDAHAVHESDVETDIEIEVEVATPAEVVSFDESDGFEVELAMQEEQLFDSAESEIVARAEEAAGEPLDDAGAEGPIDVDALFDGVDEPVKKHSGR